MNFYFEGGLRAIIIFVLMTLGLPYDLRVCFFTLISIGAYFLTFFLLFSACDLQLG